jgi:hypothetical protein
MTAEREKPRSEKPRPKPDLSKQPTTDPGLSDPDKTPGLGMVPDPAGDAPTG